MKKRNNNHVHIASKQGLAALLLVFLMLSVLVFLTGWEEKTAYEEHEFFLRNDRGTYTFCELVMPVTEEPCPLVFMAHGFKGTRNSGGAEELSKRLAEEGIAAVRIDFNSRKNDEKMSPKTGEYTLYNMTADGVMTIHYVLEHYNVDPDRIGIHGRSMGGRVAMMMGNESEGGIDYKALSLVAPAGNASAMVYYMGGQEQWEHMKVIAKENGYCEKQDLKLSSAWFEEFEAYNPAKTGYKFGQKPVLVYYNTLDHVVLPETSLECAAGYENAEVIEVTTEDGHGYEMGFETSELKDQIMDKIVTFFVANL
ncbi:MAG: prolyl oligopeptidase family serine peptidase [Firmicutes bacterium]|nr:prolyl oligopeptidase family serine peptidase [Bacillota bacterium]